MSLFASMRTALSGMNAQGARLATVSDNIANVNTAGYKNASTEFETVMGEQSETSYVSGSVTPHVRQAIQSQGALRATSNVTDMAVSGNGFFVVTNASGGAFLTRAGTFVPDEQGFLVNEAGYKLLGYPLDGTPGSGTAGPFETYPVNINKLTLMASPSSEGRFTVNLNSQTPATDPAELPSMNASSAAVGAKKSMVVYDKLGSAVTLDIYFNKVADNSWEVSVFDRAAAGPSGNFPYASGPLAIANLGFDGAGKLPDGSLLSIAVPNGETLTLDLSKATQLASSFTVLDSQTNGNSPSAVESVVVSDDGTLYSVYENGARAAAFKIPLGTVRSPDNLIPTGGNAFQVSATSGDIVVADAMTGGLGKIRGSSLEDSTVDLGSELATMIEAQRSYTANSKVFQTSADLLTTLVNLR
jgi:flagellar hook protein FlgE